MLNLSLGLMLGGRGGVSISVTVEDPGDGTIEVVTVGDGTLDITVSGATQTEYNGTYNVTLTDLDSGPVNLVPAAITGTATEGETLTRDYPGLWVYAGTGFSVAQVWQDDDVNITGDPSGNSYTLTASEVGGLIELQETATDSNGTSDPVDSNALGPVASALYTFTDDFSSYSAGQDLLATSNYAVINSTGTWAFREASGEAEIAHTSGTCRINIVHDVATAADQSIEATYRGGSGIIDNCRIGVRMSASSGDYSSGYFLEPNGVNCDLMKRDASGSIFTLNTYTGVSASVGTVLKLTVTGTSPAALVAVIGGATQTTINDDGTGESGAILTSGKAGIQAFLNSSGNYLFDNLTVDEV